ncbi:hypothetical protein [Oryza sativa Japonica Group]|uniref:Uncharacterized protein P0454A11.11 n=1 Tax=Oryza sativa subsp. japonica TaxID=39947 RepID=Q5N9I9_ORYSJ|nr:hypothetical protein [Oryza sativa Japonica Group]
MDGQDLTEDLWSPVRTFVSGTSIEEKKKLPPLDDDGRIGLELMPPSALASPMQRIWIRSRSNLSCASQMDELGGAGRVFIRLGSGSHPLPLGENGRDTQ